MTWLALVSPCASGCVGGPDETDATSDTNSSADPSGTSAGPTTGGPGTDGETDTEGPSYPDCGAPGTATVELSVTIDGTNEILATWDDTPTADIDGPCEVLASDAAAGVLSLSCVDLEGFARTVDIAYSSDPPVTLVLAEGPVELSFNYVHMTDEVSAEPPSEGTSFAVSQGGSLLLAGLDGQYSSGHASWAGLLPASVQWSSEGELCDSESSNECYGIERRRATFEVNGTSVQLFDHDSAALGGGLQVVLERMDGSKVNPSADDSSGGDPCCCHGPPSFFGARFLIGTPG